MADRSRNLSMKSVLESFKAEELRDKPHDEYSDVEHARKEWEAALNVFNNVSQPDLVDYAIYNVTAAEKRYTYLLKQMKEKSLG